MVKSRAGHIEVSAYCWQDIAGADIRHNIAMEVPVSLVYNGISYAVMMATPADLEDFALGFSISEGIIQGKDEMLGIKAFQEEKGILLAMDIPDERFAKIAHRKRRMTGRTGCGLCGVESLEDAVRSLPPVQGTIKISSSAVYKAYETLHGLQPEKQATGAVHSAAFVMPDGHIRLVREDVGRHNALDKLIGAAAGAGMEPSSGFILVTSRCSFEMVQKTVSFGTPVLAAISAPTTLAVSLAEKSHLTLIALARREKFIVFSHPERIGA
jgi:FdhD protein